MKKKLVMTMAMVVAASAILAGCGSSEVEDAVDTIETVATAETIEDLLSNEAIASTAQANIDSMLEDYADYYDSAYMQASANDIEYVYIYAEGVAVDASALDDSMASMDTDALEAQKESIGSSLGITPDTITYTYYTYEGELVGSYTF